MSRLRAPSVPARPPPSIPSSKLSGAPRTPAGTLKIKMSTAAKNFKLKVSNQLRRLKTKKGDAGNVEIGPGSRESPTTPKTDAENQTPEGQEQLAKQNSDDPNSQHSPEGKAKTKDSFMTKVKNGALGGLMLLPIALLLSAMIQGLIDCENIDKKVVDITDVTSAAWPEYADWWPEWAPQPQMGADKVWISYSPGIHLLTTDTINITVSNTAGTVDTSISGSRGILNNDDDAVVQIQLADTFNPNEIDFSNVTAKFEINTSCEDRIIYSAGQDVAAILDTGSDVFSNFFGGFPWKTILIVIIAIAAFILAMKGIAIMRS
jgi:hypothetical protein